MADLYCVPLGQTARHLFYEKMSGQDGGSVLVLPNRYLRRRAQTEADVECIGIDTLANRILNKNGYVDFKEINRRSQELVTAELIEYLAGHGNFRYFDRLITKKGFIKAAASLIGQLSRSGATEEQITDALLSWGREGYNGQKDEDIARLYALYRQYLKNENWFDLEGKYRLAVYVLEKEQVQLPWENVYISDFYSFDVLQLEFLKQLSRHCHVEIGLMYEDGRENIFAAVKNTYGYLAGFCNIKNYGQPTEQKEDLQFIARNILSSVPPIKAENIMLTELKSREQEIRWVLTEVKKLLAEGVRAQDILITLRSLADYNGLKQVADEYGLPVSLPHTSTLAAQPAAEFVLLFLKAYPDNREGTEAYFNMLGSAFGKLVFSEAVENVGQLRRDVYHTSRRRVQQLCSELYGSDAALSRVNAMLDALPARADLTTYITLLKELLCSLDIEKTVGSLYKQQKIDLLCLKSCLLAHQGLQDCLDGLLGDYRECKMADSKLQLAELLEILADSFAETELVLEQGKEQGVLLTEVVNVQGQQYDHVFLMGLREGEFPAVNSENWIYDDKERAELSAYGIEMPNTAQAYSEDMYFFAVAVAQCRKKLVCSWFKDDSAGASAYAEELLRLFDNLYPQQAVAKQLASVPEALSVPGSDDGWTAAKIGCDAYEAALCDKKRLTDGTYNGMLTDTGLLQQVKEQVGTVFSASKLEIYASCPFSFLGSVLWQQQSAAEKEETLEPADEGSLLHEVLAEFMSRHLHEKLTRYPIEQLEDELLAVFEQRLQRCMEKVQAQDNVLWQADRERLRTTLHKWLLHEYQEQKQWSDFVPCAVEQDFKRDTALTLTLSGGEAVSFIGRIDRLDGNGSKVFVTDYKRSSAPAGSDLTNGLDLQLPVYLLAAEKLSGKNAVAGGGYLVLKDAERKACVAFEPLGSAGFKYNEKLFEGSDDPWQEFAAWSRKMLREYVEDIYQGRFPAAPAKGCSEYCPLQGVCRISVLRGQGGEDDG